MKLQEAIEKGMSIVCENDQELNDVLNVLHNNNIPCHSKDIGRVVTLCDDSTYFIGSVYFPAKKLPATDFLQSNN